MTIAAPPAPQFELQPYKSLSNEELQRRIDKVRQQLGSKLLILGHHYQQDEVIALADLSGGPGKVRSDWSVHDGEAARRAGLAAG